MLQGKIENDHGNDEYKAKIVLTQQEANTNDKQTLASCANDFINLSGKLTVTIESPPSSSCMGPNKKHAATTNARCSPISLMFDV